MRSFSFAPGCGDGEGDDTAVKPSSTLRILNFFIFPRCEWHGGDAAPEARSPVNDEGNNRSRSFLQHVSFKAHILESVLHRILHGWCLGCHRRGLWRLKVFPFFSRERLWGVRLISSDSASRCVSNSLSLALSLPFSTQSGNIAAAPRMRNSHRTTAFQTLSQWPGKYDMLLSELSVTLQKRGRDSAPGAAGMQDGKRIRPSEPSHAVVIHNKELCNLDAMKSLSCGKWLRHLSLFIQHRIYYLWQYYEGVAKREDTYFFVRKCVLWS